MAAQPGSGIKWPIRLLRARTAKVALRESSLPPPTIAPGVPPSTQKPSTTIRRLSKTGLVAILSFMKSGPAAKDAMQPTDDLRLNTPYLYPLPPRPERVLWSNPTILGMTFSVCLSKL